jgi:prophage antirepressor-like protein
MMTPAPFGPLSVTVGNTTMLTSQVDTIDYHGKPLRVAYKDGEPWFFVNDLCRILNLYMRDGNPSTYEATRRLRPDVRDRCPYGHDLFAVVNREGLSEMAFWDKHRERPDLFVWDINEAMVSGRYQTAAA